MRHLGKSRSELFEELDQPVLKPLPGLPYEFAIWKKARVHIDYHIEFDKHYYSVPYTLVRKEVFIRATEHTVEVFYPGQDLRQAPACGLSSSLKGPWQVLHDPRPYVTCTSEPAVASGHPPVSCAGLRRSAPTRLNWWKPSLPPEDTPSKPTDPAWESSASANATPTSVSKRPADVLFLQVSALIRESRTSSTPSSISYSRKNPQPLRSLPTPTSVVNPITAKEVLNAHTTTPG